MPQKRDLKLSDYGISNLQYRELKYFCMQYNEKRRALADGYRLRATPFSGLPRRNWGGSPTESQAVRNLKLKNDVDLIEKTAQEADKSISSYLLKNVTEDVPYEYMDVPLARKQFYEVRRYFFYLLAQKR